MVKYDLRVQGLGFRVLGFGGICRKGFDLKNEATLVLQESMLLGCRKYAPFGQPIL